MIRIREARRANLCSYVKGSREAAMAVKLSLAIYRNGRQRTPNLRHAAELTPYSSWGELTDLGRTSTLRLGKQLRARYVDKCAQVSRYLTMR